jgi:hypothetical protein
MVRDVRYSVLNILLCADYWYAVQVSDSDFIGTGATMMLWTTRAGAMKRNNTMFRLHIFPIIQ